MEKDKRQIVGANAQILIAAKESLNQANLLKEHLGRKMKKDGVLRTGFNLLEANVSGIVASIEAME